MDDSYPAAGCGCRSEAPAINIETDGICIDNGSEKNPQHSGGEQSGWSYLYPEYKKHPSHYFDPRESQSNNIAPRGWNYQVIPYRNREVRGIEYLVNACIDEHPAYEQPGGKNQILHFLTLLSRWNSLR